MGRLQLTGGCVSFVTPEPSVASSLLLLVLPGSMERSLSVTQNQAHSRDSGEEENEEGRTSPSTI